MIQKNIIKDFSTPRGFDEYLKKTIAHRSGFPFSILAWTIDEVRENFILPHSLWKELYGFSNLMGIYMKECAYKKERLLYYHTTPEYHSIPLSDVTGKLLFKMKSIANDQAFDAAAEQELGLSVGILNRLHFKQHYAIKTIEEQQFNTIVNSFTFYEKKSLVHLIAIKGV